MSALQKSDCYEAGRVRQSEQRSTLRGLGLYKINDMRIVPDTAATLGMINRVGHLVTYERLDQAYVPTGRRHTKGKKAS